GAAEQDSEKSRCRQDVRSAQPKPLDGPGAEERKQIRGYRVGVIAVNFEERFDVGKTFLADDRQRKVERVVGARNRVLCEDQLDARITNEKCVGSEPCGEDDQDYGERAEQQG